MYQPVFPVQSAVKRVLFIEAIAIANITVDSSLYYMSVVDTTTSCVGAVTRGDPLPTGHAPTEQ